MSGLAAAICFDEAPLADGLLSTMLEAAAHRGPDGRTTWYSRRAALGVLHFLTLPEQRVDAQPCVERTGSRVAVFDGRLDNRDELADRFGWRGAMRACDDVEYALMAWRTFGELAPCHLDGDFAFIGWDPISRELHAFRDPLGVRPLHWMRRGDLVLVASDVAQLLAASNDTPDADLTAIADLLACAPAADTRTLFRAVHRIPGGHRLEAKPGSVRLVEYWRADPRPSAARRTDRSYREECRAVMDRAVRARLRAATRVAVFFSGGLDSSAILASAVRLDGGAKPVVPVSLDYGHPESDEACYRDALAASLGLDVATIRPCAFDGAIATAQAVRRQHLPDFPSDFSARPMKWKVRALDARVALGGAGGDYIFSGSTLAYADLLRRGRVLRAIRRFALDRRMDSSGWARSGLLTNGIWPLLPRAVRTVLRRPARAIAGITDAPPWLRLPRATPPLVPSPPRGVSHASWEITTSLRDGWTPLFIENEERSAAEDALDERFPFFDRALIEFALSLPEEQRRRGVETKYVLRQAFADAWPAPLLRRKTKADFSHVMTGAYEALGGAGFFGHLEIAAAGWVDQALVRAKYDRFTRLYAAGDPRAGFEMPRLWVIAATEVWHRAVFGAGRSAAPCHAGGDAHERTVHARPAAR